MPPALEDKVAIITGAGRGIGKTFALRLAEEGAKLLLPDISLGRAEGTAKETESLWFPAGEQGCALPLKPMGESGCGLVGIGRVYSDEVLTGEFFRPQPGLNGRGPI